MSENYFLEQLTKLRREIPDLHADHLFIGKLSNAISKHVLKEIIDEAYKKTLKEYGVKND